ncbi:MAG: leucyl aminopeptidase family protein [Woeseiaceae bacterium]|nr:leucyl aminopeptidase family protein [Woeseiaceae bacterium]
MPTVLADKFTGNQVNIVQSPGTPTSRNFDAIDHLLIVVPDKIATSVWRKLPQGNKLKALFRRSKSGVVPAVSSRLPNKRQTAVHLGKCKPAEETFERLAFARRMVGAALNEKAGAVGVWVEGFDDETTRALVECVVAAALAASLSLPAFKSKEAPPALKTLRVLGCAERLDLDRVEAEAAGNNLARWLSALPANKLDAREYAALLRELSRQHGWKFKRYGIRELEKMGAGAFLSVAQGNEDDSACMVRLRYRPDGAGARPALSLVGKGIIFDTGGTNLKPFSSMLDMHIDMGGSAVAVGTLLTISALGLPWPVDCWLAITENKIGPRASKSQDVVTAANGKTIQIIHTDAEGRMALADALHFAGRDKPGLIIDYATLTGACMTAVTTRYCGVFSNQADLHPVLKRSGRLSGERVWPFPIGKEFLSELASETADIRQCSPNVAGDHILAATFLNEFVPADIPWVHVDMSACMRKGGLAHIPSTITGFGVRFTMNLLLDQGLLTGATGDRAST